MKSAVNWTVKSTNQQATPATASRRRGMYIVFFNQEKNHYKTFNPNP